MFYAPDVCAGNVNTFNPKTKLSAVTEYKGTMCVISTNCGVVKEVYDDVSALTDIELASMKEKVFAEMDKASFEDAMQGNLSALEKSNFDSDLLILELTKKSEVLYIMTPPFLNTECNVCCKADVKLQCCSLCKCAYYCGKECQGVDWKAHKAVCKSTPTQLLNPKGKQVQAHNLVNGKYTKKCNKAACGCGN